MRQVIGWYFQGQKKKKVNLVLLDVDGTISELFKYDIH